MLKKVGFSITLFIAVLLNGASALKSVKITVPPVVLSGSSVTLKCDYDLEGVQLYSLKWYFQELEFFRHVPKEIPENKYFNLPHFNIDMPNCDAHSVTLKGVRRNMSGIYVCEVSCDAPFFQSGMISAKMIVVELPSSPIVLSVEPSSVEIGSKVKAECYSPGSDPAANLTWFINDEPIIEENESVFFVAEDSSTDEALGLHSKRSKIEVTTNRSHFPSGRMTLRCDASVYDVWRSTKEAVVAEIVPNLQTAPALGSTFLSRRSNENSSGNHTGPLFQMNSSSTVNISAISSLLIVIASSFFR